jgi:hypothetical protein
VSDFKSFSSFYLISCSILILIIDFQPLGPKEEEGTVESSFKLPAPRWVALGLSVPPKRPAMLDSILLLFLSDC